MLIKTATEYLRKFYSGTSSDVVSLREIFIAYKLDLSKEKNNRIWIGNKLTYLKEHNLVKPIYDGTKGNSPLSALKLTDEGRRALGRTSEVLIKKSPTANNVKHNGITLDEVVKAMPRIKQENPEFEINFDFRLRSG